jgi:membrane protein implicated in regulation of membrane protease activity
MSIALAILQRGEGAAFGVAVVLLLIFVVILAILLALIAVLLIILLIRVGRRGRGRSDVREEPLGGTSRPEEVATPRSTETTPTTEAPPGGRPEEPPSTR